MSQDPIQQQPLRTSLDPPAGTATPPRDFSRVLGIIAEEIGTSISDLHSESNFADFGLDSLLSLTVTSRINDEMAMDLPSTLFIECPTVQGLRLFIESHRCLAIQTPELSSGSEDGYSPSKNSISTADDNEDFRLIIRQTIAEETGTPEEHLALKTCLADIGVDSLLGLTIADTLSEALGYEVPRHLLTESGTLEEVESALQKALGLGSVEIVDDARQNSPSATSIVLQRARTQIPQRVL